MGATLQAFCLALPNFSEGVPLHASRIAGSFGFLVVTGALLGSLGCATQWPKKNNVPLGKVQPIDGVWEVVDLNQRVRFKVEKGQGYLPDSENLILKEIEEVSPKTYKCKAALTIDGQFHSFAPATIEVLSDNKLLIEWPGVPDLSNSGAVTWYRVVDGNSAPAVEHMQDQSTDPGTLVTVAQDKRRVRVHTEIVSVSPGPVVKVKRSRMIAHELSYHVGGESIAEVKAGIPFFVKGQVKAKIEGSAGWKWSDNELREYEITLDGNGNLRSTRSSGTTLSGRDPFVI